MFPALWGQLLATFLEPRFKNTPRPVIKAGESLCSYISSWQGPTAPTAPPRLGRMEPALVGAGRASPPGGSMAKRLNPWEAPQGRQGEKTSQDPSLQAGGCKGVAFSLEITFPRRTNSLGT